MSYIVPYYKELEHGGGAFIRPDGKVLTINDNKHEEFAEKYCNGKDYNILTGASYGPTESKIPFLLASKEEKDLRSGIDIFSSSSLSREQLVKYKRWIEKHHIDRQAIYVDFLVFVLAYDKVETQIHNLITTTATEPHVRFFNYYLMDWHINHQKPLIYDEKLDIYKYNEDIIEISDDADREAEEELNEIKAKVLIKDRPYFFKD